MAVDNVTRFTRIYWWGGWPWKWRFYYVGQSQHGPFGELMLGFVSFVFWRIPRRVEKYDHVVPAIRACEWCGEPTYNRLCQSCAAAEADGADGPEEVRL